MKSEQKKEAWCNKKTRERDKEQPVRREKIQVPRWLRNLWVPLQVIAVTSRQGRLPLDGTSGWLLI